MARMDWRRARSRRPTEVAFPKEDVPFIPAKPASPVRHIQEAGWDAWSPWREIIADERQPMSGEPYTVLANGGRMWTRERRRT